MMNENVFSLVPTVEWDVGEVLKSQWNLVHSRIGLRWNNDRHEPSSRLYSRYHRSTIQLPELTAGLWEEAGLEAPGWSFEETLYLWKLSEQFDFRFQIIADRYDFPIVIESHQSRSVAELRERMHFCLGRLHPNSHCGLSEWLQSFKPEEEASRRQEIESRASANAEQARDSAVVRGYMERFRPRLPGVVRSRESLIRQYSSLLQYASTSPTMPEILGLAPLASASASDSRGSLKASSSSLQSSSKRKASAASLITKRNRKDSEVAAAGAGRLPGSNASSAESVGQQPSMGPGRKPKPSAYPTVLRSSRFKAVRVGLCRHLDKMLADLGLPPRPTVPTAAVCEQFDHLRNLLVDLAEMRKAGDSSSLMHRSGSISVGQASSTSSLPEVGAIKEDI